MSGREIVGLRLTYLGTQGSTSSAFCLPQLLHQVLVEATVGEGPRICSDQPLAWVEVSVMPELDRSCNTMLPAEPRIKRRLPLQRPCPRIQTRLRTSRCRTDFDSDYLTLHTTHIALEIARIAKIVKPARIEVYGRRGATLLADGRVLTERGRHGRRARQEDGRHPRRARPPRQFDRRLAADRTNDT